MTYTIFYKASLDLPDHYWDDDCNPGVYVWNNEMINVDSLNGGQVLFDIVEDILVMLECKEDFIGNTDELQYYNFGIRINSIEDEDGNEVEIDKDEMVINRNK